MTVGVSHVLAEKAGTVGADCRMTRGVYTLRKRRRTRLTGVGTSSSVHDSVGSYSLFTSFGIDSRDVNASQDCECPPNRLM